MTQFGYAGRILRVDLTTGRTDTIPSAPYTEGFLGGRGIAARFYWETVPPGTGAFDAGNTLVYATGPVTGFITIPGGSRWQICGKSPLAEPEFFSYANLGEKWGTYLKSAGYDALTIRGSAESPVYVHVTEDGAAVKDARHLWGKSAFEAADALKAELGKETSVLTIGTAAENLIPFATMLTDDGSSGASGFGAVMGAKKLKAIAVSAGRFRPTAARPERLEELTHWIIRMRRDTWKDWFENIPGKTRDRACYGCPSGCFRKAYSEGGRRYKFFCQAVHVYWKHALKSSGGADTGTLAIRLCDRYGLDTTIMEPMIDWLLLCHREGIISERETGIPFGEIGGARFIETLTRMIARREGFGAVLAQGTRKAAAALGREAERLLSATAITRAAETRDYDPRLIPTNALLYATEPRRPIHQIHEVSHALWLWRNWANGEKVGFLSYRDLVSIAEKFWGGAAAADYTTTAGKATAARKIQDRAYAKECLILCDFLWPIIWVRTAEDHAGDPTVESRLVSAITGKDLDEGALNHIGERVCNLQRAILLREGWGGRSGDRLPDFVHDEPLGYVFFNPDLTVPGRDGEVVSRRGARLDRADFEKMKDEYYALRGWDIPSGLPKRMKLEELGLTDVADELEKRKLLR